MNKVHLCGYLGRDFDLRYSPTTGNAVATNSLAITKRWKNDNEDKVEHTDWIPIKLFGKSAEIAYEYHKKGSQFLCTGEISTGSYIDENENEKYVWGVNVREFFWLKQKREMTNYTQSEDIQQLDDGYTQIQEQEITQKEEKQ